MQNAKFGNSKFGNSKNKMMIFVLEGVVIDY